MKFMNLPDILLIGISSYLVIYGINYFLRATSLSEYQA